jgi:hypothetical protein
MSFKEFTMYGTIIRVIYAVACIIEIAVVLIYTDRS